MLILLLPTVRLNRNDDQIVFPLELSEKIEVMVSESIAD